MKAYYKTSDDKIVELEHLKELILPDGCKLVYCSYNQLKELIIPAGCELVSCRNNQLKELIIHNGCECVSADMKSFNKLNKVDYLKSYI